MQTGKDQWFQVIKEEYGMNRQKAKEFQGGKTILYDTTTVVHVITDLSKFIEYTAPRMNPNANYTNSG